MVKSSHIIGIILGAVAAGGIGYLVLTKKSTPKGTNGSQTISVSITPQNETIIDGSSVQFRSFIEGGYPPYNYQWSFGDGTTSSDINASHRFNGMGVYDVVLNIVDANGSKGAAIATITVVVNTLVQPAPIPGNNPLPSGETTQSSSNNSGVTVGTTGIPTSGSGSTPVTTITGTTQGSSKSGSYSGDIIFTNYAANEIYIGTSFGISAIEIIGGIGTNKFNWDFGDGTTGSGESLFHTYTKPGTYTIKLTVSDSYGNSGIFSTTLTVGYPPLQTGDASLIADSGNDGSGFVFCDEGSPLSQCSLVAYAHNNRRDIPLTVRMVIDLTDSTNKTTTFYSTWITIQPGTSLKFPSVYLGSIVKGTQNRVSINLDSNQSLVGTEEHLDSKTVSIS